MNKDVRDLLDILKTLKDTLNIIYELNNVYQYQRNKSWRKRRWLVRPIIKERSAKGFFNTLYQELKEDEDLFFQYTRMDLDTFQYILKLSRPFLLKRKRSNRVISAEERLLLTIRYLASGDEILSLSLLHRIGQTTAYIIIFETCSAIHRALSPLYLKPPVTQAWRNIAKGFSDKWNMPNCVGAVDGKHIAITAPPNAGSYFYNYKGFHSIVLLAACNHRYEFTIVDVGSFGGESDGGIFNRSEFGKRLENKTLSLPTESRYLPNSVEKLPYYFVGDEAFALKTYMMRFYPGRHLEYNKRIFNYRLSRARRCIENAFGILTARWRVLKKPISCYPSQVDNIVLACVSLHNCLMARSRRFGNDNSQSVYSGENPDTIEQCHGERETDQEVISDSHNLETCTQAYSMREKLTKYFVSPEGEVSWQREYITRGTYRDL